MMEIRSGVLKFDPEITLFSNLLSDLNLTDVETGYKLFKKTKRINFLN